MPHSSEGMSSGAVSRIAFCSASERAREELEWTLQRAGLPATVDWFADPDDARDSLILRIRTPELPWLFFIDLRNNSLAASKLLRWIAQAPAFSRVLLIAFIANSANQRYLELLGADLVSVQIPDAAKLRQLYGIAEQLARLPPDDHSLPPSRQMIPPLPPQPEE